MTDENYIYEMKDNDLETGLVGLLQNHKYDIVTLYGDLIVEWLTNPQNGPLLLYVFESLVIDNFEEAIYEMFGDIDITMYVIYIDTDDESNHYMIWLFHGKYYKINLFGQVMTPEEYEKAFTEFMNTGDNDEAGT